MKEFFEKGGPYPPSKYVRVKADSLRREVEKLLRLAGLRSDHAAIVADVLVEADLRGFHSHGVQRLRRYVDGLRCGSVNPNPCIKVVKDRGAIALIDADNGLGHPAALKGMEMAMSKSETYGVGLVFVKRSHHFGIAGYYALKAAEKGYIGFVATNSTPLVAYINSVEQFLGTNPIAVAIPRRVPPPILFDAATSVVPIGKIELFAKLGKEVPIGWAIDFEGKPLYGDPKKVLEAIRRGMGALLPLGGDSTLLGGHKGSGIALIVDILCGVLSGAMWSKHVRYTVDREGRPANVGHVLAAINIEFVMERDEFLDRIEKFVNELKSLRKHPNAEGVYVPGERSWRTRMTRLIKGIPLHKNVVEDLRKLAHELGTELELEMIQD